MVTDALKRVHYINDLVEEVDSNSQDDLWAAARRSEPQDVNISFVSMPIQGHYQGANIQWVVFESTRVPPTIMNTMLAADQIWVPSEWGRQILVANGASADRCWVMPEGVDSARFHPYAPKARSPIMTFLLVGKYEIRKSIIETVLAWQQEFGNDAEVELVIKSNHWANSTEKYNELTGWLQSMSCTNVRVLWGSTASTDMVDLYQQCDVFVLPSKGEGWGLPMIEAAATGLPIVTTIHSGHTEFLQHIGSSVIPVEFDLMPVQCAEYQACYPVPNGDWGLWAQPKIHSIRQALRDSRDRWAELDQRALANSAVIRDAFSWAKCADRVVNLLHSQGLLK